MTPAEAAGQSLHDAHQIDAHAASDSEPLRHAILYHCALSAGIESGEQWARREFMSAYDVEITEEKSLKPPKDEENVSKIRRGAVRDAFLNAVLEHERKAKDECVTI